MTIPPAPRLDRAGVAAHLHARLGAAWAPSKIQSVTEQGGGNLNVVFLVEGTAGKMIVKQGLPYVRIVEDWQMSAQRTIREASFYSSWARSVPRAVPRVHDIDRANCILVMEYLGDCEVWREALLHDRLYSHSAADLGRTLGTVAFATSRCGLSADQFERATAQSSNTELEAMMEDVLFLQPWTDHLRNAVTDDIADEVARLRSSREFRSSVARAHRAYAFGREVLAHGDLHTGSIMVSTGEPRVFDGEFAHYAPAALDLGLLWGNLILAALGARFRQAQFAAVLEMIEASWVGYREGIFRSRHPSGMSVTNAFLSGWLDDTWRMAVIFAGIETGRRVIGLGKTEDIELLPPAERSAARRLAIAECEAWANDRSDSLDGVIAAAIDRIAQA